MKTAPNNLDEAIAVIEKQGEIIGRLEERLEWLTRQIFGKKSEKIVEPLPGGIDLFGASADVVPVEPARTTAAISKTKPSGHGRNPLPDNLPCEEFVIDVPADSQACSECGKQMQECGEEVTSRLCRRTEFFIKKIIRKKRACKDHPESGIATAPAPAAYVEKGIADETVIGKVVIDKYMDHIPLDRQERRMAREGVLIAKSTMCGWLDKLSGDLQFVVEECKRQMLSQDILFSDDTKIPVVGDEKGKVKKGFFWTWSDGKRWAVFDYSGTRGQSAPESFLGSWRGYLHSDAYAGYNSMHTKGVVPVFCWAHTRRKFFDAHKVGYKKAARPLQIIGRMFKVERLLKDNAISADKALLWRQRVSTHCESQLFAWCSRNDLKILPSTRLGDALQYYRNQRTGLRTYLTDIRLTMDNNLSERNLRAVVIGRKNWLFAGSDEGAKRSAIFYSIIATCQLQGIEPRSYLEKFMRIMAENPKCRAEDLIPGKI